LASAYPAPVEHSILHSFPTRRSSDLQHRSKEQIVALTNQGHVHRTGRQQARQPPSCAYPGKPTPQDDNLAERMWTHNRAGAFIAAPPAIQTDGQVKGKASDGAIQKVADHGREGG